MKLIFIDRDGVINRDPRGWTEHDYVTSVEQFHFLPGSLEAIRKLADSGYEIAVISNQAGINKGYYTTGALNEITRFMLEQIQKSGGRIRSVHYCPHRSEDNCNCRKPRTGMLEEAASGTDARFSDTYFIGDGLMDVESGKRAGCRTVLVLSGKTSMEDVNGSGIKPDFIKKDLREAVDFILSREA